MTNHMRKLMEDVERLFERALGLENYDWWIEVHEYSTSDVSFTLTMEDGYDSYIPMYAEVHYAGKWEDHGVGWNEFWGSSSYHEDWAFELEELQLNISVDEQEWKAGWDENTITRGKKSRQQKLANREFNRIGEILNVPARHKKDPNAILAALYKQIPEKEFEQAVIEALPDQFYDDLAEHAKDGGYDGP